MENNDKLLELCYLLHKRNLLNRQRNRARYKVQYYQKIKKVVKAYQAPKPETISKYAAALVAEKDYYKKWDLQQKLQKATAQLHDVSVIRSTTRKSFKWAKLGVHELNRVILKFEAEHAKTRFDIMTHTKRYRAKTAKLAAELDVQIYYMSGEARFWTKGRTFFGFNEIQKRAEEHLVEKEIHKILTKGASQ